MTNQNSILEKVEAHCKELLEKEIPCEYAYHNYYHTQRVVNAANVIGTESGLSPAALEIVMISAWFHDTGYILSCEQHEQSSVKLAQEFLTKENYPENDIAKVSGCIMATQMPQQPVTLMEKVMCDADLHHLAREDYATMSANLQKELEHVKGYEINDEQWNRMNINFFERHTYFTDYGKNHMEPSKQENLTSIKKKVKAEKKKGKKVAELEAKIAKLENKLSIKPDRGIETMFRTTSKNHLELSAMADTKANIMISVNTIILSVVVSVLIRKLLEYPNLIIPTMMLVVVCLATIVVSILATRPNISSGVFTDDDVISKKTNLLFFGNFHKMKLERYEWGMKEMMKDGEYLYGSMIKDIYYLGVVLGKKYKLLRLAYTIFMIGFVLSILGFVCAMLMFPPHDQATFYTF